MSYVRTVSKVYKHSRAQTRRLTAFCVKVTSGNCGVPSSRRRSRIAVDICAFAL